MMAQPLRRALAAVRERAAQSFAMRGYDKLVVREQGRVQSWYYQKILKLVPEIASYKRTTFRHVLNIAKKKGCGDLRTYYRLLRKSDEERKYLRVNLTLKGTHFFRGDDWDSFIDECLSSFKGKPKVKVWCAGCSSGEEAYSTLMALLDYVEPQAVDVLATDYNEELLEKVRKADYGMLHLQEIPERYRRHLVVGEKRYAMLPYLRERVTTARHDLLSDEYPSGFDIIVCRNVIKFFSPDLIPGVHEKLAASLNPGGYLFVSMDEDHGSFELVSNPDKFGLRRLGERPFYQKALSAQE